MICVLSQNIVCVKPFAFFQKCLIVNLYLNSLVKCKKITITICEAMVNYSNTLPCTRVALFHLALEVQDELHSAAIVIYK